MANQWNHFFHELTDRGIIKQVTDPELEARLQKGPITLYVGFDPTGDSLHVGHLFGVLLLKRFALQGHRPIAVVGGATGMIGDPSGKSAERSLLTADQIERNVQGLTRAMERIFTNVDRALGKSGNPIQTVNNADFFSKLSFVDFLRDVGKHFTVNHMMAKESVRARLEDREHGISYTEFSYMLLQAYDFYILHRDFGCLLQAGGSDQWGNITAGIDLIRKKASLKPGQTPPEAYGFTHPLVTKSDGTKFGKTEAGTIWLDPERTSPYELYQFFIQTADADVITFLKYFTFLGPDELHTLGDAVRRRPEKREAQTRLATEMIRLIHGESALQSAQGATDALFSEKIRELSLESLLAALNGAPSHELPNTRLQGSGVALIDLLVETGLASSKGAARKDIQGGGIYVNNARIADIQAQVTAQDLLGGEIVVLRKGKKNFVWVRAR